MRRGALLVPALLAVAAPLALHLRAREPRADVLEPGTPAAVELDPSAWTHPTWRVRVPVRATGLRVWTSGATGDIELYLAHGDEPRPDLGYFDAMGEHVWIDEEVLITITDTVPLQPGSWYVAVVPAYTTPSDAGPVRCQLHAEILEPAPVPLPFGEVVRDELTRATGLRNAYTVELPATEALGDTLRIEVRSPAANVDVVAGSPKRTLWNTYAVGESPLHFERLLLPAAELSDGLALQVYAYPDVEELDVLPIELLLTTPEDPRELTPEGAVPAAAFDGELGAAIAATVSVFSPAGGGSGVVVSPDGHVLTNAHVVVGVEPGERSGPVPALSVGFTADARQPVVPGFGAELLAVDRELDLALLRIATTLDNEPLDPGLRFPFVERCASEPTLGDTLYTLGFPMTGGSSSFLSPTLSRGILSGWARTRGTTMLKTDAETHAGVSGGACLDAEGRLVGLPTSSLSDVNLAGGMGFVVPVSAVPAHWGERAGW